MEANEIKVYKSKYLDHVLVLLKKQPTIWLSADSLSALCDFLTGYLMTATMDFRVPMSFEHGFDRDFHTYFMLSLAQKYNSHNGGYQAIAMAIETVALEKGITGFDLFFQEVFSFYPEIAHMYGDAISG